MSNRNRPPVKIVSGKLPYVRRVVRGWVCVGYTITKTKIWSDGKYTVTLELQPLENSPTVGEEVMDEETIT